jgi:thymidylate synthase (methanogen type)
VPEKVEQAIKACYQEPTDAKKPEAITIIPDKPLYDDGARFDAPYETSFSSYSIQEIENAHESEMISSLGLSITADNLDDALSRIVANVFEKGSKLKDQRHITINEERSLTVVIKEPLQRLPDHYTQEYLDKYKDEFMHGISEKAEFAYTYHERIFKKWGNQPDKVIKLLKNNPNTRRALISLWDPENDLGSSTPPCLDFIWFCIRNGKLECHPAYRSHHLATVDREGSVIPGEGAFIPNLYAIHHLHKHIADKAGFEIGPIVLTDFSGHLYVCD